jgi:hypothetical protein
MKGIKLLFFLVAVTVLGFAWYHRPLSPAKGNKSAAQTRRIERGRYLVSVAGCNDCHSPKIFTPQGPIPDTTRILSGHPAKTTLPELPTGLIGPQGWGAVTSNDFTAWSGPWGTSFSKNLTPDSATGLGSWNEKMFIKAIRTGKDMGEGRAILPPMPWPEFRNMTDEDLASIFTYLRTLPPIENAVPDPQPPAGGMPQGPKK